MTESDAGAPLPVFADVDTGVDDAMALAYLFASADAELVGIASTAGNVPVDQVCDNNLGLLELCGIDRRPGVEGLRSVRWRRRCAPPRTPTGRRASATRGCRATDGRSPTTTPPRRGCARPANTPAS